MSANENTPTPRTDEVIRKGTYTTHERRRESIQTHARQLERELAEANEKMAHRDSTAKAFTGDAVKLVEDLNSRVAALEKERDEWRACAERTDSKMLHEQEDHNKTVNKLIAVSADNAALREQVAQLRDTAELAAGICDEMISTAWHEDSDINGTTFKELEESAAKSLALTPKGLASELQALREDKARWDVVQEHPLDVTCRNRPTSGDDYEIEWAVSESGKELAVASERQGPRYAIDAARNAMKS